MRTVCTRTEGRNFAASFHQGFGPWERNISEGFILSALSTCLPATLHEGAAFRAGWGERSSRLHALVSIEAITPRDIAAVARHKIEAWRGLQLLGVGD
jgi:hypothetical protein